MVDDLLGFVQKASEGILPVIEEDLGSGFVRLHISESERRQARQDIKCVEDAVLELVRNSRDAGAKTILVAISKNEPHFRKINVIDDGSGIPGQFLKSVFQSRITSRLTTLGEDAYGIHGRGMALFSISQRAMSYRVVNSIVGAGSVFEVIFDLMKVRERSDQSTIPRVIISGGKRKLGRGPHNVKRVLMQFALYHPTLRVFFGSFAEVMSTIFHLSKERESQPPLFSDKDRDLSIWRRGVHLMSPKELGDFAVEFAGMEISLRNCQRIASGELASLDPLLSLSLKKKTSELPKLAKLFKTESVAERIGRDDVEKIKKVAGDLISDIGRKYFLELIGSPEVRRSGNRVQLTFNLKDSDEQDGL